VLNRDSSNRLTISSPLEAHKSHTVVYSMVGLDVGFEHPNFAVIEVDHSELDNTPNPDWRGLMKKVEKKY
jgi:splicing factor 3B subunit 3